MNKLTLSDGRILAYEIYGDPKGKPVFYFHGWPASRLSGKQLDKAGKKLGLKIISPDRPGYGYSSYKKGRTLLDWPDDVLELASFLKLRMFSVLGSSGGAPYALACAYKIPSYLNSVTVVSGLGPVFSYFKSHNKISLEKRFYLHKWLLAYYLSQPFNFLYKPLIFNTPNLFRILVGASKHKNDNLNFKNKNFRNLLVKTAQEAFHNGAKGPLMDLKIYGDDWGFELRDIKRNIIIWHSIEDTQAPFWLTNYEMKNLKNYKFYNAKNLGHYLLDSIPENILEAISSRQHKQISPAD